MQRCYLDRNDELLIRLEQECIIDNYDDSLPPDEQALSCPMLDDYGISRYFSMEAFSSEFGSILVEVVAKRDEWTPYLPYTTSFRIYKGDVCEADGSNLVQIQGHRVCEAAERGGVSYQTDRFEDPLLNALDQAMATYLNLPMIGLVKDAYVEGEKEMFAGFTELARFDVSEQQVAATSEVKKFTEGVDFSGSPESIMEQFSERFSRLIDYRGTPFAKRGIRAPDVIVCRRTAHEIVTSGFMFACGEYASTFMAALSIGGFSSRLVKLVGTKFDGGKNDVGHDMVEVLDKKSGKWVLTDPTMSKVYKDYDGGLYFSAYGLNWIRIGTYASNWHAGCFSREDSTRMRVEGMREHHQADAEFPELE